MGPRTRSDPSGRWGPASKNVPRMSVALPPRACEQITFNAETAEKK